MVKKNLKFFILITVSVIFFSSTVFCVKPIIDVYVEITGNSDIKNIADSVFLSELLNTNKFTLALRDSLRTLIAEMQLQDLLSTENIILSKKEQPQGFLKVNLDILSLRVLKESKEYIRNDISGDYIYHGGEYIRVIVGARFKFDGKNYLQAEDGIYVKGTDGKYYSESTFYSRVPHENSFYSMEYRVSYELNYGGKTITDNFENVAVVPLVLHSYDPYNNRLFKEQYPATRILNTFADQISSEMGSRLMDLRKLYGSVESVKMPRVLIDIGSQDGAKPGLFFGVYDNKSYIAELRVVRSGGDYSECEVTYLKKGAMIKEGMQVVEKREDFVFPVGIRILYSSLGDKGFVVLALSQKVLDIHREDIATFGFAAGFSLPSFNLERFDVTYSHKLISSLLSIYSLTSVHFLNVGTNSDIVIKPFVGFEVKVSLFTFQLLTTPDLSTFEIGGGVSW